MIPGRIAYREEGKMWNAYFAKMGTMDGAVWLGSIAINPVHANPKLRTAFMELIKEMVSDIMQDAAGQRPQWWDEQPAPDHERTKE